MAGGETGDQIGQGVVVAGHHVYGPSGQVQAFKKLQQPLPPALGRLFKVVRRHGQHQQLQVLGAGSHGRNFLVPAVSPELGQGLIVGAAQAQCQAQLPARGRGPLAAIGQSRAQGAVGQALVQLVPLDLIGAQAGDEIVYVRQAAHQYGQAVPPVKKGPPPPFVRRHRLPGRHVAPGVIGESAGLHGQGHGVHLGHAMGQARSGVEQGRGADFLGVGQVVQGGVHLVMGGLQLGQAHGATVRALAAVALQITAHLSPAIQIQAMLFGQQKPGQPF